jgi:hypothetical protein
VPQDERQHSLANAAETDEQDAPGKLDVNLLLLTHDACLSGPDRGHNASAEGAA